jgi:hypothetical protein
MARSSTGTRHSRLRRAGQSAYGLLLVGRNVVVAAMALLVLAAGVWTSWGTAQYAMLTKGRELGTVTVVRCGAQSCSGSFVPTGPAGEKRPDVTFGTPAAQAKGEQLPVVVKPGTDEVVRTGWAGVLYAWVPFGGALLLGALLLAGGLRMQRTAWAMAALGAGLMGASFATL